jgi:type IV secretory pathway VirB3-like protein
MLQPFHVHQSLLRPPLLFGVERRLFFAVAACAGPFFTAPLSFASIVTMVLLCSSVWALARKATHHDTNFSELVIQNLKYKDNYDGLPSPRVTGTRFKKA